MDKREAVRIPVRVHARCRLDTGVVVDGYVEDLSRSGMFVAIEPAELEDHEPARFAEGSQTMIALDLPGEAPLQVEAEVVRQEALGVGLRIRRITSGTGEERDSRPLANFLMRQAQQRLS